ncbi:MAG: AAA family ATPase, partial [Thermoleophilaceae bacterium]
MKLLRLQGENFRSFAEIDLDLNVDGLIAVLGPNGAGKSSLFGAVEWALFGGKRGSGALPARRDGCGDAKCWVELEFESAGRIYRVRRIDRKKATLVDVESGREIANTLTDTSRQAAAVLGLTQDMFCGTFYARQREVQALAESAKVSERREQLERLLGIEHLRLAADLARRDAHEQKLLYEALAAEAPDLETLKADLERIEGEARRGTPAVQQATAELERVRDAHAKAKAHVDELTRKAEERGRRQLAAREADAELSREQL